MSNDKKPDDGKTFEWLEASALTSADARGLAEALARVRVVADLAESLARSALAGSAPINDTDKAAAFHYRYAESLIAERERRIREAGGVVTWSRPLSTDARGLLGSWFGGPGEASRTPYHGEPSFPPSVEPPIDIKNDPTGLKFRTASVRRDLARCSRRIDCTNDLAETIAKLFRSEGWEVTIETIGSKDTPIMGLHTYLMFGSYTPRSLPT